MNRILFSALLVVLGGDLSSLSADDWPEWLGPNRESVWREEGIVEKFPTDGLPVKWRMPVGFGYSGPAVADGRVFVTDYVRRSGELTNNPGGRDKLEGTERVLCYSAATGDLLWKHEYEQPYKISYPGGPRCTPTVNEGKVYTLGAEGDLLCLNARDGKVIWSKELKAEYDLETPIWGFSAHPLVHQDLLYCVVGGKGSVAVAFDKNNGREVWRKLSASEPGYCPPTLIEHAGKRQLLIWHPEALNSLNPQHGEVNWSVPLKPGYGMSITMPRKLGRTLYASGISHVGALYQLNDNETAEPEVLWRGDTKSALYSANSTPFLEEGMMYGCDCHVGALMGVRLEDGKRLWETFAATSGGKRRAGHGTVYLVKQGDRFFLFSETGDLILAKLSPQGYQEISRFHVLDASNEVFGRKVVWTHPAFANRCVFVRNDKELVCVNLAAE